MKKSQIVFAVEIIIAAIAIAISCTNLRFGWMETAIKNVGLTLKNIK